MKVLFSPHNDDAALFAAFTCLRERPLVVTVYDSYVQGMRHQTAKVSRDVRRQEDVWALYELGCEVRFLGLRDDQLYTVERISGAISRCLEGMQFDAVYGPALEEGGHQQHNLVAYAVEALYPGYTPYLTYTENGKSTDGILVGVNEDDWIPRKLRALSCYTSQMIPELGCRPHFLRGLEEYYKR